MRCVFCLAGSDPEYIEMAKVLVLSAGANTRLELLCVYDGSDQRLIEWLESKNVLVIRWSVSFLEDLRDRYDGEKSIEFCRGTFLCMEVPYILNHYGMEDEYILYVDTDTMFVDDVDLNDTQPQTFCAPKDWSVSDNSRFSTGVLLMNCRFLLSQYSVFQTHIRRHNYNFSFTGMGPCDQGAWNTFFENKSEELPNCYDWKPWWGSSDAAIVIHFSGPMPRQVRRLIEMENPITEVDKIHKYVVDQDQNSYIRYVEAWEVIAKQIES